MSKPDEEDDGDKPYEASQKKLDDARRKGDVPRSADLTATAAYAGVLLAVALFGQAMLDTVGTAMTVLLDQSDRLAPLLLADGGATLAIGLMQRVSGALLPLALLPAGCAFAAIIAQRALTFSGDKLAPKLSRLSPLSNARQKFGRNGLFEFAKSAAKLFIVSTVLAVFFTGHVETIVASAQLGAGPALLLMRDLAAQFMVVVVLAWLAIGALDFLWQWAEHHRKLRMSHKEVTDETKQTEGDPHLKQRRRQRGMDIASNRMMLDVPTADVVVVNPTHYAVALKWSRRRGAAPVCVAKGVHELAARIRETAQAAGVPVHRDAPTARALHGTVEIGAEIAPQHYRAVAAAIRFADDMRARRRAQHGSPGDGE